MRCPCCDVEAAGLDGIEAFVLGAGLGTSCGELEGVAALLCTRHLSGHIAAINSLRAKVDAFIAAEPHKRPDSGNASKGEK